MQLFAQHIMSKDLITLKPEMLCEEAIELLVTHKISGAPVTDQNGDLVGVISMQDILRSGLEYSNASPYFGDSQIDRILEEEGFHLEDIPGGFVSDYMTHHVYTELPHTTVEEMAKLMVNHRIHRVIIVKPDTQKPIGIVTTFDLLKLIAAVDTLEHDINECSNWYSRKFSQIRFDSIPALQ